MKYQATINCNGKMISVFVKDGKTPEGDFKTRVTVTLGDRHFGVTLRNPVTETDEYRIVVSRLSSLLDEALDYIEADSFGKYVKRFDYSSLKRARDDFHFSREIYIRLTARLGLTTEDIYTLCVICNNVLEA